MRAAVATQLLIAKSSDEEDALHIIKVAVTIAALPSFVSTEARALAGARLRELALGNPGSAEILAAIVLHLESY